MTAKGRLGKILLAALVIFVLFWATQSIVKIRGRADPVLVAGIEPCSTILRLPEERVSEPGSEHLAPVRDVSQEEVLLGYGTEATGAFDYRLDDERFVFYAQAGDRIFYSLEADCEVQSDLTGPFGNWLQSGPAGRGDFIATTGGAYKIALMQKESVGCHYRLCVAKLEPAHEWSWSGGDTEVEGDIGFAGDNDLYFFRAEAGEMLRLQVETTRGTLDPSLQLFDHMNRPVNPPPSFRNDTELLEVVLRENGLYSLRIAGHGTTYGLYRLRIEKGGRH